MVTSARHPERFDALGDSATPDGLDEELAAVYRLSEVLEFGTRASQVRLDRHAIQRFTVA